MPPPPAVDIVVEHPISKCSPSLPEAYRSIAVPSGVGKFWRKLAAFAGPGYLVAVGYMDPGNWATDLAGGSAFGYTLLSVVLFSSLMAMLLQALAAKLGSKPNQHLDSVHEC
jgi:manganese transport protein